MELGRGFTLLELLMVMGILAIVTISTVPILANTIGRTQLETTTQEVVDVLRRAQGQSMAAMSNTGWGVHFTSSEYTLFDGLVYNVSDPDNVVFEVPGSIDLQTISLNGGGVDVRYAKLIGTTNEYGSILVMDTNSGESKTVTIGSAGSLSRN